MDVIDAIDSMDDVLKLKCQKAIASIQRTLDLYGPEGTAFSFNGGKDSTVLLHLIRAAVAQQRPGDAAVRPGNAASDAAVNGAGPMDERPAPGNAAADDADQRQMSSNSPQHKARDSGLGGIRTFVFKRDDDFREIRDFVSAMDQKYCLNLEVLSGDFKAGLTQLVNGGGVRAIFLGTRRGDPNAEGQEFFCPSSIGWPPFMRVNPVLEWTYSDVWTFLRGAHAPYCSLYDHGYTSIGGTDNTSPNSALQKEDGTFCPAHALADGRMERAGRAAKSSLARQSAGHTLTKSAGLIIVGDEILAAKVDDVNTAFLCAELRAIGWHVKKVVVIADEVAAIATAVHDLSLEMDLVITAGGVGPTPDDVTLKGVAEAFGAKLSRDPTLEHRLRKYFGDHLTTAHLKLAEVPEGECELIDHNFKDGRVSPFSLPRCRNVYVLPGVPDLLQQKWRTLKDHLTRGGNTSSPWQSIVLRLSLSDETTIAPTLERLNAGMHDMLAVGSYPQADGAGIVLSLEGKDPAVLAKARDFLRAELPAGAISSEEANSPRYSAAKPAAFGQPQH